MSKTAIVGNSWKTCSVCGWIVHFTGFSKDNGNKRDGLQAKCKECEASYHRENREKHAAQGRDYYRNHKERLDSMGRDYRAAHHDEILEQRKQYRQKNRKLLAEKQREYAQTHKEQMREYQNKRLAAGRGLWARTKYATFTRRVNKKYNFQCVLCLRGLDVCAHHMKSKNLLLTSEDRWDSNNGVCVCGDHHLEFHHIYGYGDNTPEQFTEYLMDYLFEESRN